MLGILIILGILLTATVAILWWRSSSAQRLSRLVRATASLQSIDSVPARGVVKVIGRVKAKGALLQAPLSGRPCVFYEVFVEDAMGSQPIRESDATSFAVVSDTALAQFRVEWLKVLVASETCFVSGLWNDAAPRLEKFLARYGQSSKTRGILYINRTLTYTERRIEPDDTVSVLGRPGPVLPGRVVDVEQNAGGYRDAPKAVPGRATIIVEPLDGGVVVVSKEASAT